MKRYLGIFILLLALILIRTYEDWLFYDPYLLFFKNDFLYMDNPRREVFKLTLFTSLRYILNSGISLGILYLVFKDRQVIKFSVLVFTVAFIILIPIFLYFVINPQQEDYYLFFNFRRFLIQPILLLLLLPAFYYQRQVERMKQNRK